MPKLVVCIMGPTASGKTGLACELAKLFPVDIISVDSALIYRGMDIGTAKPTAAELQCAPHHLIDIIDPPDTYSAAQFCADASSLCDLAHQKGRIPLLVGGTMMYFNALQKGLSTLPEANDAVRQQIEHEALQHGWAALHQKLRAVDPQAAARIHVHDTQRIQRALEVYYVSGISLSSFQTQQKAHSPYHFINIALFPKQRVWLHERIALRFEHMLRDGFIEEVHRLQQRWDLDINLPSMRCVGYRQALEHLGGDYDLVALKEKAIAATRQLAKRQLTWLRHWQNALYFDPQNETFTDEIIAKIREILDNEVY